MLQSTLADVTISETVPPDFKEYREWRQHRGLSLTTPLEFWEQVSANAIKCADGLVLTLWFMSVSLKVVLTCIRWPATPLIVISGDATDLSALFIP